MIYSIELTRLVTPRLFFLSHFLMATVVWDYLTSLIGFIWYPLGFQNYPIINNIKLSGNNVGTFNWGRTSDNRLITKGSVREVVNVAVD